jgi:hypothetical protein
VQRLQNGVTARQIKPAQSPRYLFRKQFDGSLEFPMINEIIVLAKGLLAVPFDAAFCHFIQ